MGGSVGGVPNTPGSPLKFGGGGVSPQYLELPQQRVGLLVREGLVDADDGRGELSVATCDLRGGLGVRGEGQVRGGPQTPPPCITLPIRSEVGCRGTPTFGGRCSGCSGCSAPGCT